MEKQILLLLNKKSWFWVPFSIFLNLIKQLASTASLKPSTLKYLRSLDSTETAFSAAEKIPCLFWQIYQNILHKTKKLHQTILTKPVRFSRSNMMFGAEYCIADQRIL